MNTELSFWSSLHELPINSWFQLVLDGDPSALLKFSRKISESERILLNTIWEQIDEEFDMKIGILPVLKDILNTHVESRLLEIDISLGKSKDKERLSLLKSQSNLMAANFKAENKSKIQSIKGSDIDVEQLSTLDYFITLKQYQSNTNGKED